MQNALLAISKKLWSVVAISIAATIILSTPSAANSRIKDLVNIEGIRENQLIGYGLVVGLNGTGDTLRNAPFTDQSLKAMLERLGINAKDTEMKPENTAAVLVTASLPAFARAGTKIDVNVSSMGDAGDLKGGTLLATPLMGFDGEVYAVAQGGVAVAGFSAQGEAANIVQGVPTNGRIANGGIIEKEIDFELSDLTSIKLSLHNPDLTTAKRVEDAINGYLGTSMARAIDPSTIQLDRPLGYELPMVNILTEIEQLLVRPDNKAQVVIDERTGIIVMGSEVRISPVAIAQGNLTIRITETPVVSQPNAFSEGGETVVVPRTQAGVENDDDRRLSVLPEAVSLQELVNGLNSLGIGPRDMISILQAIKAAGAMQAEIKVM
ncbi:flagellar P-ring protein 1 [Kordiimonas sediminis]|uniref:Flagellar P-ring protein n=1 Tax=Kordiimonas sediminis TaxID=1735581 RepID=A0A919EAT7_9PROT|nr:flagellar basal body P-ring protein FlgI [Kordiimonas sediminis]GHF29432.1 flagellar P-ring protein 1 [Kordiimonas sediminis]